MQTTPGMHDRPVRWLCCDASGKERAAGAAAIFDPAKPHDVTLAVIPWTEGQWTGEGLSTLQEGFTASTSARLLMQHMPPNTDLIEALDSMSASFILRAGKASSTERSDAVAKWRQTLMADFTDLRIFTIHNKRERGTIPDALQLWYSCTNMYSACSSAAGSAARSDSCCCWIHFRYWICDAYAYNCTTVRVHEQSYTYGTGSSTVLDLLIDLCSTGNSTTYGNFKRTTCF
jgi:hypothetical protein